MSRPGPPQPPLAPGQAGALLERLPPGDRALLSALARRAAPGRVALVGGAVRDLLLGGVPTDLDCVLEVGGGAGGVEDSNAESPNTAGPDVAEVAAGLGLPFLYHPAFGNATLTLPAEGGAPERFADLVRARREHYPQPGQNPLPEPGSLEDDLRRRDFGINALALVLGPGGGATLLDVVGGLADLEARVLRPLHPASLHEDASRLVRGARLAGRLDLAASPELLAQVPAALAMAEATPRLWAELWLLLAEPRPGRAAAALRAWGAGGLLPETDLLDALGALADRGQSVSPTLYAAALLARAPDPEALSARLGLGGKALGLLARAQADGPHPPGSPEHTLRALLRPEAWAPLTGRDVVALGVPPGPAVGRALAHLSALRRAGTFQGPEDERAALRVWVRETGKAGEVP